MCSPLEQSWIENKKKRLEETYETDVLQKIKCNLLIEDNYFDEMDNMAQKESVKEEDQRKVCFFLLKQRRFKTLKPRRHQKKDKKIKTW